MSFINYASREINCKIVYYGPGLCGKTTNLQHIYSKTAPEAKGKMISLQPRPSAPFSLTSYPWHSVKFAVFKPFSPLHRAWPSLL